MVVEIFLLSKTLIPVCVVGEGREIIFAEIGVNVNVKLLAV